MTSMMPGFIESVKEGWNKLTGGSSSNVDDDETEDETPANEQVTGPTLPLAPLEFADSLTGEMTLLRADMLLHSTQKAKNSLEEYDAARKKLTTLMDFMAEMREHTTDSGTVEIKGAKLKRLIQEASRLGVHVPQNKTTLTRDERENVKHEVDGKVADLNRDIQLSSHKITKSQQDHTQILVDLKKFMDQYNEIIRTFNRNIVSR